MTIDPQWIIAGASTVSALAIVIAAFQIRISLNGISISKESLDKIAEQIDISRSVYMDSHELERRKKAIVLLKDWSLYLSEHGTAAKGFVSKLNKEQCKEIISEKELIVDEKYKDYLERNIPNIGEIKKTDDCREREVKLSRFQSSIIRRQCSSYLNLLETILSASRYGIADNDMITEQFSNLVTSDLDDPILNTFRIAIGGVDAYPSIHDFVDKILDRYKPKTGKTQLGESAKKAL